MTNGIVCEAPIIAVANEITELVNDLDLCVEVEAVRTYVNFERLERITSTQVWVQPVEMEVENSTRSKDTNIYVIDVGVFGKVSDDSDVDELMALVYGIYQGLRRQQYLNDRATIIVEQPTLYSPEMLAEMNLFAGIVTVRVRGETS